MQYIIILIVISIVIARLFCIFLVPLSENCTPIRFSATLLRPLGSFCRFETALPS